MPTRRLVTGHSAEGKAIVAGDAEITPLTISFLPGSEWLALWSTQRPPSFPDDGAVPPLSTYFPPPGGFSFGVVTFPPDSAPRPVPNDRKAAYLEMERVLPGFAAHMERSNPGMHTSDSIDFGYVISGEIWLELDGGKQTLLRAGDTFVQNGTRHGWRNKGTDSCKVLFTTIGVQRQPKGVEVAKSAA